MQRSRVREHVGKVKNGQPRAHARGYVCTELGHVRPLCAAFGHGKLFCFDLHEICRFVPTSPERSDPSTV